MFEDFAKLIIRLALERKEREKAEANKKNVEEKK